MNQKKSILRLTVDDGVVWFGTDNGLGTCSRKTVDEFILSDVFRSARVVRVIGTHQNASLISKLYQAHLVAGLPEAVDVQVGSPAMAPYKNPVALLSAMWRASVDRTAVNSYWATLNSNDYAAFALMAAVNEHGVGDKAIHAARYHPAWPAVSFIWKFDPIAAIKLLVDIGDPRWFQHPVKPSRLSRLYAYLGLNLANVRVMCQDSTLPGPNIDRAVNVIHVWRSATESYAEAKQPRAFLDRIEVSHKDLAHGALAASQRLIRFVREVWMANRSDDPEVQFLPERFFRHEDEIDAYFRHLKSGPNNSVDTVVDGM